MRRKKVIIWTDYPIAKTGLARNGRQLALYLYNTGKYDIVYYCCGMSEIHPDFAKFPFKVVGCLPNDPMAMDAINKSDEGYKRHVSYGGGRIDELVKSEKCDVLIMLNDSWGGFGGIVDKPWYNKIFHMPVITLDSLPFLPDQKTFIEKSKQFYVWSDFAERESKRLGYNHVKTLTGMLDPNSFFKIPKHKKQELRNKFNIPQDAFVTGFVSRSQIRKQFPTLLKSFAQFRKENPNVKAYLLLFTHWSEGWDLPRLIAELNIPNEFVITCYICRNCLEYQVKPFTGQDQNCPCCNGEKAQITCNVGLGIQENELNDVYGLMDLYVGLMDAGGLEYGLVEALHCEIPIATVPYASGEMFTNQDFVFTVDCSYSYQLGTNFLRAVPFPSSVVKIMRKVWEMSPEKRAEIGKKGRNWAVNTFSPQVVGKMYEEIIDAAPFSDYDFKFDYQPKNPDFPFLEIENVDEFVRSLYKNILLCTPDENGFNYWRDAIKNGQNKRQIYAYFIDLARKDNEKAGVNTKSIEDFIDKESINKRFLIVLKESAGDIINATALLESFKESYPDWDLYFACDTQYFELLEGNPYLYRVIPFHQSMLSEPAMTGQGSHKGWFSGYCNLGVATQQVLNYLSHDKIALTLKD